MSRYFWKSVATLYVLAAEESFPGASRTLNSENVPGGEESQQLVLGSLFTAKPVLGIIPSTLAPYFSALCFQTLFAFYGHNEPASNVQNQAHASGFVFLTWFPFKSFHRSLSIRTMSLVSKAAVIADQPSSIDSPDVSANFKVNFFQRSRCQDQRFEHSCEWCHLLQNHWKYTPPEYQGERWIFEMFANKWFWLSRCNGESTA